MALSLQNPVLVKQKALLDTRKPKIQAIGKALFSYLAQHKGNPDLQLVPFADLAGTASIIADAACKLMGLYIKKPAGSTTAAFIKGSDSSATASATAPALSIELPTNQEEFMAFPDGIPFTVGLVLRSDTAADGSTGSATADKASGFAIIAAP